MEDHIVRAVAADGQIRGFAATTKNLTEEARRIHNTSPVATAALGRLLTAGAMMGLMMKSEKDLLTLQIRGNGPIGGLVVTADGSARVKGYVYEPNVIIPASKKGKLDVAGAIGEGTLRVTRDLGMKEPYTGQVQLQTGEIAEDLTYYFALSEQTPSSVGLGVLMSRENRVKQAGGFIVQLMPFTEEAVIARLEENLNRISAVTSLLEQGNTPRDMIDLIFEGLDPQITDTHPAGYHCGCCRERVARALQSVGKKELEEMIRDSQPVEMRCHFCNTAYTFSVEELKEMAK